MGELLLAGVGGRGYRARAIDTSDLTAYWPAVPARTGVIVVNHGGSAPARQAMEWLATVDGMGVAVTGQNADDFPAGRLRAPHGRAGGVARSHSHHLALESGANPDTMRGHEPGYARALESSRLEPTRP